MDEEQLIKKLDELGVTRSSYSLEGKIQDGVILDRTYSYLPSGKTYNEWRVFNRDRDYRDAETIFYSETEALQEVYDRLKRWHDVINRVSDF